jgi:hypothetical protein
MLNHITASHGFSPWAMDTQRASVWCCGGDVATEDADRDGGCRSDTEGVRKAGGVCNVLAIEEALECIRSGECLDERGESHWGML